MQLASLLAEGGDLDELRTRADAGNWSAAQQLASLLAEGGDLDGAKQIWLASASAGHGACRAACWHADKAGPQRRSRAIAAVRPEPGRVNCPWVRMGSKQSPPAGLYQR